MKDWTVLVEAGAPASSFCGPSWYGPGIPASGHTVISRKQEFPGEDGQQEDFIYLAFRHCCHSAISGYYRSQNRAATGNSRSVSTKCNILDKRKEPRSGKSGILDVDIEYRSDVSGKYTYALLVRSASIIPHFSRFDPSFKSSAQRQHNIAGENSAAAVRASILVGLAHLGIQALLWSRCQDLLPFLINQGLVQ